MEDRVRPSQIEFDQVLRESYEEWSSYSKSADATQLLPYHCIDLTSLLGRVPAFLGHGLIHGNESFSFSCEEREFQGKYGLFVKGNSIWNTSKGTCNTKPRIMQSQLLLGIPDPLKIQFSENSPLAEWPGVHGISEKGSDNHITVFFLAWAYILSAQWVELLGRSPAHTCRQLYKEGTPRQDLAEFDVGYEINEDEARWWKAILSFGWEATTDDNGRTYLSPWSVAASDTQSSIDKRTFFAPDSKPPSCCLAVEYLTRFCKYHFLYDQCFASLAAALYIPSLGSRSIPLPMPTLAMGRKSTAAPAVKTASYSELLAEHSNFLPHYMTLSCNVFGLRSLLCSTFFNIDVKCNLVSAWMTPILTIIDPLAKTEDFTRLAILLGNRQPTISALWLGSIIVGTAKNIIRDIRIGMTALDLHAAAWTSTLESFISVRPGKVDEETILREDECRLLFILGCDGHTRPPICPWKPFGKTRLADIELDARQHAKCNCHCLEYVSWHWESSNGNTLEDTGSNPAVRVKYNKTIQLDERSTPSPRSFSPSESLSELATRAIFAWLRSSGYPTSEKVVYQHSWFDIEGSDDEEIDDDESGNGRKWRDGFVEDWLMNTDSTAS